MRSLLELEGFDSCTPPPRLSRDPHPQGCKARERHEMSPWLPVAADAVVRTTRPPHDLIGYDATVVHWVPARVFATSRAYACGPRGASRRSRTRWASRTTAARRASQGCARSTGRGSARPQLRAPVACGRAPGPEWGA